MRPVPESGKEHAGLLIAHVFISKYTINRLLILVFLFLDLGLGFQAVGATVCGVQSQKLWWTVNETNELREFHTGFMFDACGDTGLINSPGEVTSK